MTTTIILASILMVVLVAIILSMFEKVCNKADSNLSRQIQLLEQKLILENKLK